jgi:hypothetical protein
MLIDCSAPETIVTTRKPVPRNKMKQNGRTADTRKCRRRTATRCRKITDIAFSSTVNARALKKIIVTSSTPPMT